MKVDKARKPKEHQRDGDAASALSVEQVAARLHVSAPTVRRMAAQGDFECFRTPGGHLRIVAASLGGLPKKDDDGYREPSVLRYKREEVEQIRVEAQLLREKRELEKLKARLASGGAGKEAGEIRKVSGISVYNHQMDGMEMNDLRALADIVRDREKSCIVVLGSVKDDKASLLVAVTKDLSGRFPANELIKPLAAIIGGTGGGRPEMAQAGGKLTHEMDRALAQAFSEVERKAKG